VSQASPGANTGDVRVEECEDPKIIEPTDAIIRITATCICGSQLWPYRGVEYVDHQPMGHEYVGVVEKIGDEVKNPTMCWARASRHVSRRVQGCSQYDRDGLAEERHAAKSKGSVTPVKSVNTRTTSGWASAALVPMPSAVARETVLQTSTACRRSGGSGCRRHTGPRR
jgi:D-arabinose 1-dehydrogenase-like Zn-dependent alcohol dehydrogenase